MFGSVWIMYKVVVVNFWLCCWCSDFVELKECKIERFLEFLLWIIFCFDECEEFIYCYWFGGNFKWFSDCGGEVWIFVVLYEGIIIRIFFNYYFFRSYVYYVWFFKFFVNFVNFVVCCDICVGFVDIVERMVFGEVVGFCGMWFVGVGVVMIGFGIFVWNGDFDDVICDVFGVVISVVFGVVICDVISDVVSFVFVYIICDIMSVIWSGFVGMFFFFKCSFLFLCVYVGECF